MCGTDCLYRCRTRPRYCSFTVCGDGQQERPKIACRLDRGVASCSRHRAKNAGAEKQHRHIGRIGQLLVPIPEPGRIYHDRAVVDRRLYRTSHGHTWAWKFVGGSLARCVSGTRFVLLHGFARMCSSIRSLGQHALELPSASSQSIRCSTSNQSVDAVNRSDHAAIIDAGISHWLDYSTRAVALGSFTLNVRLQRSVLELCSFPKSTNRFRAKARSRKRRRCLYGRQDATCAVRFAIHPIRHGSRKANRCRWKRWRIALNPVPRRMLC